jgi:hypothetical protein
MLYLKYKFAIKFVTPKQMYKEFTQYGSLIQNSFKLIKKLCNIIQLKFWCPVYHLKQEVQSASKKKKKFKDRTSN